MSSGRDEQDSVAETSNEAEEDMLMHPWTKSGLKADQFLQKLQPMQGSQLPPKAITSGGRQRLTAGMAISLATSHNIQNLYSEMYRLWIMELLWRYCFSNIFSHISLRNSASHSFLDLWLVVYSSWCRQTYQGPRPALRSRPGDCQKGL